RLHRVLRATPERVYRAFLDPDAMAKWRPPNGFTSSCRGKSVADGRSNGRARPRHQQGYFCRIEIISPTFTSRPLNVFLSFSPIRSVLSITDSSRPLIFWPVSGQHSSLVHSKRLPEESHVNRPLDTVPHRLHAFTTVNFF